MDEVRLSINGKECIAGKGQTILEAALRNGIRVPHLCYHPRISRTGACRICIVRVNETMLKASCTEPVADGMRVVTEDDEIAEIRKGILKLLLAEGDHNCFYCDANGECELQALVNMYNIEQVPEEYPRRNRVVDYETSEGLKRNENRCVLCGRCIKACAEIQVSNVWDFADRGSRTCLTSDLFAKIGDSGCVKCGTCVQLCPTGALSFRTVLGRGQAWELEKESSICVYCGIGCKIDFYKNKEGLLVKAMGNEDGPNRGHLCVKGRFGFDFVQNPKRLSRPLIRENGVFGETTWDEALDLVANKLMEIRRRHGPDSIAALSSAKCTNEENYLMQKFMRAVIGTNNVDHCARLCHSSTVAGLAAVFGSGAMTNSIREVPLSDGFLVIGSNTTENHPVLGSMIKDAVINKGKGLIVADPRRIELSRYADYYFQVKPGTNIAILNGLMHVLIEEGLYDKGFVAGRTEGFQELAGTLEKYTPEFVAEVCGLDNPEDIPKAARLMARLKPMALYYSMGITQFVSGVNGVKSTANLQMLLGNIGVPGGGVNPLRGQNNVQGACDMGALPLSYPAYQSVTDEENRARFEEAWGVTGLPVKPGLTVVEMLNAAIGGQVRAIYAMGENPVMSDPNQHHVIEALGALDFLVVQDIFFTETARYADVVLPASAFIEKKGTITNTERRVQPMHRVLPSWGDARDDWWITAGIAKRMGAKWDYRGPEDIFEEMRTVTPSYAGITYERIERELIQWPCPTTGHPGTQYLHKDRFPRGPGLFTAVEYTPPAEGTDAEYPMILTTGRLLEHFHTGTMTRNSKVLDELVPEGFVEINPNDAKNYNIGDGEVISVSSRRGSIRIKARVTERSKPNMVFIPFHFYEAAANKLTIDALDPTCKIPEYKVCSCRIEKIYQ
ncbi:MAG: Formate dehydrogenase H [Syntrophorhabdus sp. PtaU1.Bin058]|nr:MAG: Formate dehydrogenase H [Syntrophorhabdus sp. PtaU1.Bin058]